MPPKGNRVLSMKKKKSARKGSKPSGGTTVRSTSSRRSNPGVPNTARARARVVTSAIPANIGASMPRSFFGFGGRAQAVADQDSEQSLRIVGRDLYFAPIQAGSSSPNAGFGGTATYYAAITPSQISNRLENVEEIFQYYAIRSLRAFYAPATGSTSTVQVALGYVTDYALVDGGGAYAPVIPAPTQTQVLEFSQAALFPAWQPAVVEMKQTGTKLWHTVNGASGAASTATGPDYYQGALACRLLNGVASTVYGQLWMEYVVDFYAPCPVLSSVVRRTARDARTGRATAICSNRPRLAILQSRTSPSLEWQDDDDVTEAPTKPSSRGEKKTLDPPPAGTPSENGDGDGWVDPSPPAFRTAPSSAPGTPGYTPRVAIPAKRAQ
jgi:hypothetical protein